MRLAALLVLAALAAAVPAHAQQLDTRRMLAGDQSERTACRFTARNDLYLSYAKDGSNTVASWPVTSTPARPAGTEPLTLMLGFVPKPDATAGTILFEFWLSLIGPFASPPERARVTLDGGDVVQQFKLRPGRERPAGEPRTWHVEPLTMLDALGFGEAIYGAKQAGVELTDANGSTLARYVWDVSKSRERGALLEAVKWKCK